MMVMMMATKIMATARSLFQGALLLLRSQYILSSGCTPSIISAMWAKPGPAAFCVDLLQLFVPAHFCLSIA